MKIELTNKCDFFALLNPNKMEDAPILLLNDMMRSVQIDFETLPVWAKSTIIKASRMRKIMTDPVASIEAPSPKEEIKKVAKKTKKSVKK